MGSLSRWSRSLWRILGSTRLALILMLALMLALLLVSLFPQIPADPTLRETWLRAVALRYGPFTGLLHRLGLFDAYHSPWFWALLAALLLNTMICTIQRLPRLWGALSEPPTVAQPEAFYQGFAHRAEWAMSSLPEGVAAAEDALRQHHYRIQVEHDQEAGWAAIYAERGRWSQVATVVSHLAAVLLLVAMAVRPVLSWQESGVVLLPGQVYAAGHGTELTARAGQPVSHEGGTAGLQVPLGVLTDASPAITRTVSLNRPLTFEGVSYHLQGYGPAAQITAPEGTVGLALGGSQAQEVTLSAAGITLQVAYVSAAAALFVEARTVDGELLGSGNVAHGQEIEVAGIPVTFQITQYTVWQVSHDPTFGVALVAACLFLAAALVSLWVPHRRLWLRVDGRWAQMVGSGDWGSAFDALAAEIGLLCARQVLEGEAGNDG